MGNEFGTSFPTYKGCSDNRLGEGTYNPPIRVRVPDIPPVKTRQKPVPSGVL